MTGNELKTVAELIAQFREQQIAFQQRLWKQWQRGFDLYDLVLLHAQNAAVFFLKHHRAEAVKQKDALFEAQTRLQARAYRTACEVHALLLSGNHNGALARWRTMHEILVVMLFLEKHGSTTAQRFLDYDIVQTSKNWGQYNNLPANWQTLLIAPEEEEQIRDDKAKLLAQYGTTFKNDNGWAAEALGLTGEKSRVDIQQLEKNVGLERFRLYYNIASNYVHVNMKGLPDDLRDDLAPSIRGLTPAAATTLIELADCTLIMARLRPTPDTDELEQTLNQLTADASQMFLEIEKQLERGTTEEGEKR